MKIYKTILATLFAGLSLISCDVIDKPFNDKEIPVVIGTRKVFLEDYTGFDCPNCPTAVKTLITLQNKYGDHLIAVAVHSGFFSIPKEGGSILTYNFRTTVGNAWNKFFGIIEYPKGLINRQAVPSKEHMFQPEEWEAKVLTAIQLNADIEMSIVPSYDEANSKISAEVTMKYLKNWNANQNISVILVQDSIIDAQNVANVEIPNFVHNHVLRAAFNGTWGDAVSATPIEAGNSITKKFELPVTVDTVHPWEPKHLKIIAFVHNNETKEVLQVEEVHLLK